MTTAAARAAARFNVRALLPGPETALRDEVLRLRIPTHRLPLLASHAAVEVLTLQGLTIEMSQALASVIQEKGGALVTSPEATEAVVIVPLLVASQLRDALHVFGADFGQLGDCIGDALVARGAAPAPLTARGHRLEFGRRTLVMGIINATPDSFSGDGLARDRAAAVNRAQQMVEAGAAMIDVGGESTRPNSATVTADEERDRVLPLVELLVRALDVPISIDTRKPEVAAAALDSGAALLNDIWGLRAEPEMAQVAAAHADCGVIVMHNHHGVEYENVMSDIAAALRQSIAIAEDAGVAADRILVDPGFGFAKTPAQNLEVMRRLRELRAIGRPVLVGPSRKSTIGFLTAGAAAGDRLEGSLALAALAVAGGADIVRVHDVAETVRAVAVADAVVRGTPSDILALPPPGPTG
ncbi:MAG: dihydropteroate synthase [Frankia sp.]|nr:dihydropteroate synthase [Frankia sp.]